MNNNEQHMRYSGPSGVANERKVENSETYVCVFDQRNYFVLSSQVKHILNTWTLWKRLREVG